MTKKALLGFSFLTLLMGLSGPVPFVSIHVAYAKPPDWAPAHGYRRKHKDDRDDDREDWKKKIEEEMNERFPTYQAFQRLDENRDGRISLEEWNEGKELFERLDRNDDGRLSRAEYARVEEERGLVSNFFAKMKDKLSGLWDWLF